MFLVKKTDKTKCKEDEVPVLVSARVELIFLRVAAVFSFSRRRMSLTLMFLVVAEKSRTSSSLLYSANEQVCWSWEGA